MNGENRSRLRRGVVRCARRVCAVLNVAVLGLAWYVLRNATNLDPALDLRSSAVENVGTYIYFVAFARPTMMLLCACLIATWVSFGLLRE